MQGNAIKILNIGDTASSVLKDFSWDGSDNSGNKSNEGIYKISATATINGKTTRLITAGDFKVRSIGHGPYGVVVNIDDLGGISLDSIIKIL